MSSTTFKVCATQLTLYCSCANIRTTGDETKPVCRRCQRGKRQCAQVNSGLSFQRGYNPPREHNPQGSSDVTAEYSTSSGNPAKDSRPQQDHEAIGIYGTEYRPWDNIDEESPLGLASPHSAEEANYGNQIRYYGHTRPISPQLLHNSSAPFPVESPASTAVNRHLSSSLSTSVCSRPEVIRSPRVTRASDSTGLSAASLGHTTNIPSISTSDHTGIREVTSPDTPNSGVQLQHNAGLESYEQARLVRLFIDNWGPGVGSQITI